jgi:hypothetical protein
MERGVMAKTSASDLIMSNDEIVEALRPLSDEIYALCGCFLMVSSQDHIKPYRPRSPLKDGGKESDRFSCEQEFVVHVIWDRDTIDE